MGEKSLNCNPAQYFSKSTNLISGYKFLNHKTKNANDCQI